MGTLYDQTAGKRAEDDQPFIVHVPNRRLHSRGCRLCRKGLDPNLTGETCAEQSVERWSVWPRLQIQAPRACAARVVLYGGRTVAQ